MHAARLTATVTLGGATGPALASSSAIGSQPNDGPHASDYFAYDDVGFMCTANAGAVQHEPITPGHSAGPSGAPSSESFPALHALDPQPSAVAFDGACVLSVRDELQPGPSMSALMVGSGVGLASTRSPTAAHFLRRHERRLDQTCPQSRTAATYQASSEYTREWNLTCSLDRERNRCPAESHKSSTRVE